MPTSAFYQLTDEKKNKLIDAATEEFSTTPYEKVSVYKIAQSAKISRSGFYYYFENKADLYRYIYEIKIENEFIDYMNSIEKKCDIFSVLNSRFNYYLSIKGTENEPLVRQMIQNIRSMDLFKIVNKKTVSLFNGLTEDSSIGKNIKPIYEFFDHFDTSNLAVDSREDIFMLTILINMLTIKYVSAYLEGMITMQEATDKYNKHIDYLKYGFLK